ncbi:MAG: hypothetical protein AMJ53_00975, partial [Gammaproteobacteria bacterium SG8_11]
AKAVTGTQSLTPAVTTTYLLDCSGSGGSTGASAIVTVNDTSQPFVDVAMQPGLSNPSTAPNGSNISVSATVQNIGNASTSSTVSVYFYLSTDQTYDSADRYLVQVNSGYLSAGQSKSISQSMYVPANMAPGTYYLLAVADRYNYVVEQDDPDNLNGNNKAVGNQITITVGADIAMGALSGPASGFTGARIDLSTSVQNIGSGSTSGYATVYFYLSTDQTYDSEDRFLVQNSAGYLSAGQSKNINQSVYLSASLDAGNYYILAVADRYNYVLEQDDPDNLNGNNKVVGNQINITVGADVAMETVIGPSTAVNGTPMNLSGSVTNIGSGSTSNYVSVYFYLSSDQNFDEQDRFLGQVSNGYVDAGQSKSFNLNVNVPGDLVGDYYLLAVADRYNYVLEQDDPDNLNGNNKVVGNIVSVNSP